MQYKNKLFEQNYVKNHIDKLIESPLFKFCKEYGEKGYHIASECKKLV